MGFAVMLVELMFGLIYEYLPNTNDTKAYVANTELQNTEASKMPAAKKRVAVALAQVKQKDAAWQAYVATRTPPTNPNKGGINLDENAYQLGIDTFRFRDSIQRALNAQLRKGGVKVLNAPTIEMLDPNMEVNNILPTFYNFPPLKFPAVMFDFGAITVQGTYKQIMDHLRAYKYMPNYLAVTDGLTLTGTSPVLTATYNLSIVGFIRGRHVFPPVAEQAAASAIGGGGRGRGGFGGGGGPMGPGGAGMGPMGGPPGMPPGMGRPGMAAAGGPPPGVPGGPVRGGGG